MTVLCCLPSIAALKVDRPRESGIRPAGLLEFLRADFGPMTPCANAEVFERLIDADESDFRYFELPFNCVADISQRPAPEATPSKHCWPLWIGSFLLESRAQGQRGDSWHFEHWGAVEGLYGDYRRRPKPQRLTPAMDTLTTQHIISIATGPIKSALAQAKDIVARCPLR